MSEFTSSSTKENISYAQSALYDRQIRLWGIEAQNRMQNSSVLIVGFTGLHGEVIKNIVLAGVGVTIYDNKNVTLEDLSSNFFFTTDDVGKSRLDAGLERVKEYNEFVKVEGENNSNTTDITEAYIKEKSFSVILLDDNVKESEAVRINNIARKHSIPCFWSAAFGFQGLFICDFGIEFQYKNDPPHNKDVHSTTFPSFSSILTTKWKDMQKKHFEEIEAAYVNARMISSFYGTKGKKPDLNDLDEIKILLKKLLKENNIDNWNEDNINNNALKIASTASSGTFAVISAVIGGFLAQEILKAIQRSGIPMQNIFVYDGNDEKRGVVAKCFPAAYDTVTQPIVKKKQNQNESAEPAMKRQKTDSGAAVDILVGDEEDKKADPIVLLD